MNELIDILKEGDWVFDCEINQSGLVKQKWKKKNLLAIFGDKEFTLFQCSNTWYFYNTIKISEFKNWIKSL